MNLATHIVIFAIIPSLALVAWWFAKPIPPKSVPKRDKPLSYKQLKELKSKPPRYSAQHPTVSLQEQLEVATGFTITKIVRGERNGWRWLHIHFTWKWNGYVTKSAFAKAACRPAAPNRELKMKAFTSMIAATKQIKLEWYY